MGCGYIKGLPTIIGILGVLLSVYSLLVIWISSKKGSSVLDKLIINQLADYGQVIWLFLLLIGISMFVYGLVFGKEEKGRHL